MSHHVSVGHLARRRGISMLELMVIVAITATLVVTLIPALGRARAAAVSNSDQANLHNLSLATAQYAANNNNYAPTTAPTDAGDWYPHWDWNAPLNAVVSSNGIWGIRSCAIPNVTQGWPPNPANPGHYNEALGLGVLVEQDYTTLETMYVPSTRVDSFESEEDGFPFWARRDTFGKDLVTWATDLDYDGRGWLSANGTGTYGAGTNYLLPATYAYRSGDWTSEVRFGGGISAGNPNGGLWRNMNPGAGQKFSDLSYLRSDTPTYNERAIIADYRGFLHFPLTGGNVLWGDGSANFWSDANSWRDYTTGGVGPHDQWAGFPAHQLFATWLFLNADIQGR